MQHPNYLYHPRFVRKPVKLKLLNFLERKRTDLVKDVDCDSQAIKDRILEWTGPAFPREVREEAILAYADYVRNQPNSCLEYYRQELMFGTGGIRGIIGHGPGCINQWTLGRVTLALCTLIKAKRNSPKIVIAYDSRKMSQEFAQALSGIAAQEGVRVYLFREVTPTPILSYAVRKLKADAGIVITASHNPPEYNGYKAYGADGAQIAGAMQKKLEKAIQNIKDWATIPFLDVKTTRYRKYVQKIGPEIKKDYIQELAKAPFVTPKHNVKKANLKIVYTPLHGTGGAWLPPLLRHYGFDVILVEKQARPNGEFPTVKYPNPEDHRTLYLAEKTAHEKQADMFLASDPDADRLGAGLRTANGDYNYLNGNQLGSIMCAFLCEKFAAQKNKNEIAKKVKGMIVKTIVTTDLQRRIAEANGIVVSEVLTGFKYIAEQMNKLEHTKSGKQYVFGGEESYGYLPIDYLRDKDALSAALLLCEILAQVGDLNAYLQQIYLRYGFYLEELKSITLKGLAGQSKMQDLLNELRKRSLHNKWEIGKRKVVAVLDYQKHFKNGKYAPEVFKGLPTSNVLQFLLEPEGKLTIRPSGTEPKIKLYTSLRHHGDLHSDKDMAKARYNMEEELALITGQFIVHTGLATQ